MAYAYVPGDPRNRVGAGSKTTGQRQIGPVEMTMDESEIIYWLRKMMEWHQRMDGSPLSFFRDEKMAKLDELVERGFAVKHSCWADITPAGRAWAEGNPRLRLLMEESDETVA